MLDLLLEELGDAGVDSVLAGVDSFLLDLLNHRLVVFLLGDHAIGFLESFN